MNLQRPSLQRAGTLRYLGPARPGPLHNRSGRGKMTPMGGSGSQVKAGPENLGRSIPSDEVTCFKAVFDQSVLLSVP